MPNIVRSFLASLFFVRNENSDISCVILKEKNVCMFCFYYKYDANAILLRVAFWEVV